MTATFTHHFKDKETVTIELNSDCSDSLNFNVVLGGTCDNPRYIVTVTPKVNSIKTESISRNKTNIDCNPMGYLRNLSLDNLDLSNKSLRSCDLTGASLDKTNLYKCDLRGCMYNHKPITKELLRSLGAVNTKWAIVDDKYVGVPYIDLSDSKLEWIYLPSINLRNVDLSNSSLVGINLTGSDLMYANLSKSNLAKSVLIDTQLLGANMKNSQLSCSKLDKSNMVNVDLSYSDLCESSLVGCYMHGVNLTGTLLGYTNLDGANMLFATINGAPITKAQLKSLGALNTDTIIGIAD